MNVLSLFDGMSCGRIALERVGIVVDNYFASEVDKYAIKVSKHNYPDIIHIGDVSKVSYRDGVLHTEHGEFDVGNIDLVIGGSPCTNFSFSGKREGMITSTNKEILQLEDYLSMKASGFKFTGQSYLFWEFVRILKETNAKHFLLENVQMSSKWKTIIDDTLGVKSVFINSNLFSAQNRPRLYWTNINVPTLPKSPSKSVFRDIKDKEGPYNFWKDFQMEKYYSKEYIRNDFYQVVEDEDKTMCLQANYGGNHPKCWDDTVPVFRRLTPLEFERAQTVGDDYTKVEGVSDKQRYKMLGNGWTVDVIAHIFKGLK